MNPELRARLAKDLEEERGSLIDELRGYGADPHSERVDRIQGVDQGFADSAAATTERAQVLSLVAGARERLAHVDTALAKMEDGTYGTCEVCGREIPEARLEARPASTRCVEHA
jgi:RNA polymerase-binding protein DksA